MLQHFGVTPYLVFDGGRLPSKAHTEQERSERRKKGRREGLALLQAGKSTLAYQELQKSIDVTPQMARNLIEELKMAGVEYVVAPYEADSQLAYLENKGQIAGILSEDSDLLVFGAKTLITKLDQYGECVVYRRADFGKCKDISLVNWSDTEFRMMAILSGCDYLPGIQGIGLKSAYRLVRQHKSIEKVVRMLQFDGKRKVPTNYLQLFQDADRTFLHQWVYCPEIKDLINLTPTPAGLSSADMPYIGAKVDADVASGIATGDLHPSTKVPLLSTLRTSAWKRAQTTVQQTPDLKTGKSISEFFKPARTPLAELDPNSFTPSPSQQRLLATQRAQSWSGVSTPSSTIATPRTTGSIRAAMQAPSPHMTNKARMTQTHKPSKARLCAEDAPAPDGRIDVVASPYFGAAIKAPPKFKKPSTTFELFSDDSICDALESTAKAAEVEYAASQDLRPASPPKKRKRFEVCIDDAEKRRSVIADDSTVSQSTQTRDLSTALCPQSSASSDSRISSVPAYSMDNSVPSTSQPIGQVKQPAQQWLYDLKMPTKGILSKSIAPAGVSNGDRSTPLLHSGCQESKQTPMKSSGKSSSQNLHLSELYSDEQPQELDRDAHLISPKSEQQSVDSRRNKQAQKAIFGSEDQLIPQSPDSENEDSQLPPQVSLKHFAFAR